MNIVIYIIAACACSLMLISLILAIVVSRDLTKRKLKNNEETNETLDENSPTPDVAFSTDKQTLDQKYLNLPNETRAYYDEIVRYAMSIEGNKRLKNANFEEYKVGKNRLVRIKIKNNTIICELMIPNLDFKNYVSSSKIEVRQTATIIRVVDETSLNAVKGCMDVAITQFKKEREEKKEQTKLRRLKRQAKSKKEEAIEEQSNKNNSE